jgi:hypothetical protein
MTCLKCGASFCWLCLSFVEQTAFPKHYRVRIRLNSSAGNSQSRLTSPIYGRCQTFSLSGCADLQSANDGRFTWAYHAGRLAARGLIGVVVGVLSLSRPSSRCSQLDGTRREVSTAALSGARARSVSTLLQWVCSRRWIKCEKTSCRDCAILCLYFSGAVRLALGRLPWHC